jgi:hypothetical protein
MILRPFFYAWVAFILLFAQQGAYTHALSHLQPPAEHQQDKDTHHSPVCDKCVVYGEVGGALHVSPLVFSAPQKVAIEPSVVHSDFSPVTLRAYSSRAPPRFA